MLVKSEVGMGWLVHFSDNLKGPGEIKNVYNTWEEFCESEYQGMLTNYGKKFTSLVYNRRDKYVDRMKGKILLSLHLHPSSPSSPSLLD